MNGNNDKSPHVLNASSNLLGLCFIVLTSLKVLKQGDKTIIDELASLAIVLFMTSSLLSFLSIRSNTKRSEVYEKFADVIFLIGLCFLFVITLLFTFNVIE
jgi:ABC-type amino acid transport system permease subunit